MSVFILSWYVSESKTTLVRPLSAGRIIIESSRFKFLRANVTNGQTFGGNSSKINSAHILMLGRP